MDNRIPQELPRQSVEGRRVSIIISKQHRRALPATARSGKAVDRSEVRHRAGFHAAPLRVNVPVHQYVIVKVQMGKGNAQRIPLRPHCYHTA